MKRILIKKFEEIEKRIQLVLDQLDDEQVNWRPNESSNSIANLIVHIRGNIHERITSGIHKAANTRDRDQEFEPVHVTTGELKRIVRHSFGEVIETLQTIGNDVLEQTQTVRNQERTNLEVLIQCATHFSEHMGQMFYIGKLCLDERYVMTSIPKKKSGQ
ncbi:DinB family protein [Paenibacillus allorhizosphaerae]|uniref:DinB family protein n=1 Tax=Paenibacillus allorhizosphaerae TaxID=2849866 RepID=UPI001E2FC67A|nr:DinB family protein [Paenibacillus allorhizosphaerae]